MAYNFRKRNLEENFKKLHHQKEGQEAHYLIKRNNALKAEINEYVATHDQSATILGLNLTSSQNSFNLQVEDSSSPKKQYAVKDLLKAQMEEK